MNIEMFFIKTDAVSQVSNTVRQHIKSASDVANQQPDWGLPSSYDVLLAKEPKRKVAISPAINNWVAGIESKEVIDFALLQQIAKALRTDVIAVQLSEVSGCCGYALCSNEKIIEHYFSEDDDNPAGTIAEFLKRNNVKTGLVSFREAVQMRNQGWLIV